MSRECGQASQLRWAGPPRKMLLRAGPIGQCRGDSQRNAHRLLPSIARVYANHEPQELVMNPRKHEPLQIMNP